MEHDGDWFFNKLNMTKDYSNRKYDVISYDPDWVSKFLEEAKILSSIFGKYAIAIEHVGSTAVPGLAGKPTIDVLILVDNIVEVDALNQKMESAGYKVLGEYVMPGARLFVREADGTRLCNIHVFQKEHTHAKEMLRLRDYFRNNPELVKEYSQLKLDLIEKYPNDYRQYRKHKDEYVEKLLGKISN